MSNIIFTCKLCGAKHPATEFFEFGLAKIPSTITTVQDHKKEWYFRCVQCNKLPTP